MTNNLSWNHDVVVEAAEANGIPDYNPAYY
jgi:hypothetical protein